MADERRWTLEGAVVSAFGTIRTRVTGPPMGEGESVVVGPVQPAGPDTVEREYRCRFCGGKERRETCPESDRGRFSCEMWAMAAVGPVGRSEPRCTWPECGHGHEYNSATGHMEGPSRCPVLDDGESVGRSCEVTDEMVEAGAAGLREWDNAVLADSRYRPVARAVLEAALRTTATDGEAR